MPEKILMCLNRGREESVGNHAGLDIATCGVANAISFYSVATRFSSLVTNLAPKISDFLFWENEHEW